MNTITVSELAVHPIKSTKRISLDKAFVHFEGLAFDRRFVLIDNNDTAITARTHGDMTQITVTLLSNGLSLSAPSMPPLTIKYDQFSEQYLTTKVWKSVNQGQHCHPDYDSWFSQFLDTPCRLVFFGQRSSRQIKDHHQQVSFADGYPALLISEASLADLNSRSEHHHQMAQFRPNIIIKNTTPFAEDSWRRIRIGEVEFRVHGPCSRCVFTTLNPDTGLPDKAGEPLSVLKNFRQGDDSKIYFGQNIIPLNEGVISQGDEVEVLETQTAPTYPDSSTIIKPLMTSTTANHWIPGTSQPLQCIAINDDTADVKTFVFKLPQEISVDYLAGQFITLNLTIDGQAVSRCYTLSSSPSRPNTVAITVKHKVDGLVSQHLHQTLSVGDTVEAQAPQGIFHSQLLTSHKVLLLSAGSGITPMLSIMRFIADNQINKDLVFCHSAHTQADMIGQQELEWLANASPGKTQLMSVLTQSAEQNSSAWQNHNGRLNQQMLSSISDIGECTVLVCGPAAFMSSAKSLLLALGVSENNYHQESFGLADELDSAKGSVESTTTEQKSCQISFESWGVDHQGDNVKPILEQAEQAGLDLAYSCRSGFCGTCKVKLLSGEVEVKADDPLSFQEQQQGYILACSCIPLTDIVVTKG